MAIISRYFTELSSLLGHVKVVNWQSQIFSREMSSSTPTKHSGRAVLFIVAELLVFNVRKYTADRESSADCYRQRICCWTVT